MSTRTLVCSLVRMSDYEMFHVLSSGAIRSEWIFMFDYITTFIWAFFEFWSIWEEKKLAYIHFQHVPQAKILLFFCIAWLSKKGIDLFDVKWIFLWFWTVEHFPVFVRIEYFRAFIKALVFVNESIVTTFLVDFTMILTLFSSPSQPYISTPPNPCPLFLTPSLPDLSLSQSCTIGAKQEMNRWGQNLSRDILEMGIETSRHQLTEIVHYICCLMLLTC